MENLEIHAHIKVTPTIYKGYTSLLEKGIYKSKTEMLRAAIIELLKIHNPKSIICEVETDEN